MSVTLFLSLPLMGIRIWRYTGSVPPHGIQLTTPHGDQDLNPVVRLDQCERTGSHYPSWGSGSGAKRTTGTGSATAHYPSWGSGSSDGVGDIAPISQVSLPLMGIRIRDPTVPRDCSGDRTHYPSWGSGSSPSALLPCAAPPTHYPSWGSGSAAAWGARRCVAGVLTTPHGDQDH